MDTYSSFAGVYDSFMEGVVPYDRWAARITEIIERFDRTGLREQPCTAGPETGGCAGSGTETAGPQHGENEARLDEERHLIVDLACGTGNLTFELKKLGCDVMGIDISTDMLMRARDKNEESGTDIMFLNQDMRELDLYCTAGVFVCAYDSFNYLLTDEDVTETLRRINNFLYPGGLFIFDFNTLYKYSVVMGDTAFVVHRSEPLQDEDLSDTEAGEEPAATMIWENTFYEENNINEAELTFFVKEDEGLYRRYSEIHEQRAFTLDEMKAFVRAAGLDPVAAFDGYTDNPVTDSTERILMVVREHGKMG